LFSFETNSLCWHLSMRAAMALASAKAPVPRHKCRWHLKLLQVWRFIISLRYASRMDHCNLRLCRFCCGALPYDSQFSLVATSYKKLILQRCPDLPQIKNLFCSSQFNDFIRSQLPDSLKNRNILLYKLVVFLNYKFLFGIYLCGR